MDVNPYQSPREVGYDSPISDTKREPEGWIGIVLWIVTLSLGAKIRRRVAAA